MGDNGITSLLPQGAMDEGPRVDRTKELRGSPLARGQGTDDEGKKLLWLNKFVQNLGNYSALSPRRARVLT